jgi:hypothetical protein
MPFPFWNPRRHNRARTSDPNLFEDPHKPVEVEYMCYDTKYPWPEVKKYLQTAFPDWNQFKPSYVYTAARYMETADGCA